MVAKTFLVPKTMVEVILKEITSVQFLINNKWQTSKHLSESYFKVEHGFSYSCLRLIDPIVFKARSNGNFSIKFMNSKSEPLFEIKNENKLCSGDTITLDKKILQIDSL
jgi:hypothetical protein